MAEIYRDDRATGVLAERVFGAGAGALRLHVRGTNFQVQVWRALLGIPTGRVLAYGDVARAIGAPAAARAVGTAIGQNPVAYLIPCHRVIREVGELGGYRWGATRKRAMIAWEAARHEGASSAEPLRVAHAG